MNIPTVYQNHTLQETEKRSKLSTAFRSGCLQLTHVVTGGGDYVASQNGRVKLVSETLRNRLRALVVLSNGSVVSVQDLPTSKSAILEALK